MLESNLFDLSLPITETDLTTDAPSQCSPSSLTGPQSTPHLLLQPSTPCRQSQFNCPMSPYWKQDIDTTDQIHALHIIYRTETVLRASACISLFAHFYPMCIQCARFIVFNWSIHSKHIQWLAIHVLHPAQLPWHHTIDSSSHTVASSHTAPTIQDYLLDTIGYFKAHARVDTDIKRRPIWTQIFPPSQFSGHSYKPRTALAFSSTPVCTTPSLYIYIRKGGLEVDKLLFVIVFFSKMVINLRVTFHRRNVYQIVYHCEIKEICLEKEGARGTH